jgi:hypothetical protein
METDRHGPCRTQDHHAVIVNAGTLIGCRLFTANDADSSGIARSAPDLETVSLLAAQRRYALTGIARSGVSQIPRS